MQQLEAQNEMALPSWDSLWMGILPILRSFENVLQKADPPVQEGARPERLPRILTKPSRARSLSLQSIVSNRPFRSLAPIVFLGCTWNTTRLCAGSVLSACRKATVDRGLSSSTHPSLSQRPHDILDSLVPKLTPNGL